MFEILSIILPVFLIILTGNLLMKMKLFNSEFVAASNQSVYYVFLPLLMFYNIAVSDFKQVFSPANILIMISVTIIVFAGGFLVARLCKLPGGMRGTFVMNSFRSNLAYIGLPVCFYAFGEHGLAVAIILMGFASPVINILAVLSMVLGNRKSFNYRMLLKETMGNYGKPINNCLYSRYIILSFRTAASVIYRPNTGYNHWHIPAPGSALYRSYNQFYPFKGRCSSNRGQWNIKVSYYASAWITGSICSWSNCGNN